MQWRWNRFRSIQTRKSRIWLVAVLLTWPLFAWGAARFLQVDAPLDQAEALAVLSGSAAYKERARFAAELFKAGRAERIILTNDNQRGGWSAIEERNPFYYELELKELERAGVPRDRIIVIPDPVSGTYDEVKLIREYAETHKIRSMLVVTSSYHSRRAWWTVRRVFQGTNVLVGLMPVGTGQQNPSPIAWWVQLRGWKTIPLEYFKILYYTLRY
jgi:uncharacterized SAM-binding protein YcdF (DUF218 family)